MTMMARIEYFAAIALLLLFCSAPIIILCIVGSFVWYLGRIVIHDIRYGTPAQNLARMAKERREINKEISWSKLCHGEHGLLLAETPPVPPDYEMKPEEIRKSEDEISNLRYERFI